MRFCLSIFMISNLLFAACGDRETENEALQDTPLSALTNTFDTKSFRASAPGVYRWQPANVTDQCVYFTSSRVVDHRVDPPLTSYRVSPKMEACQSNNRNMDLLVTSFNGLPWNGSSEGLVQIKLKILGLCLTNPAVYGGGYDKGKLEWKPCLNPQTGSTESMRQGFYVKVNSYRLAQVASHLQYTLGKANAVPECIERNSDGSLQRKTCSNLANWMFR